MAETRTEPQDATAAASRAAGDAPATPNAATSDAASPGAATSDAASPGAPAPDAVKAGEAGRSAEARELERQLVQAREQLRQAEERARENLDRWQRAQADLANYRRRAQFEREELEKYATATLVNALLPVLDNFDRAWQSMPGQFRRLTWLSGVAMIHSQLRGTLERIGLQEIDAAEQAFDPALHEAVEHEPSEGQPHVVAVLQAGYRLHERVLRPALVKVGPKPATQATQASEAATGQEQAGTAGAGAAATSGASSTASNTGSEFSSGAAE